MSHTFHRTIEVRARPKITPRDIRKGGLVGKFIDPVKLKGRGSEAPSVGTEIKEKTKTYLEVGKSGRGVS